MLDCYEYTTEIKGYQGNGHKGNGYDRLTGNWLIYYQVAKGFTYKVIPQDREDFLHDLFIAFAKVKSKYDAKGKELTRGGLVRIAQYALADYWHKWFKLKRGTDCHYCSKTQKQRCQELDLYRQCPKAIEMESLNKLIEDGNVDSTPFYEFIADDNAVDVINMLNARYVLKGYPHKLVKIAYKRYAGYPLDDGERNYLYRYQKKLTKTLL